MLVLYQFEVSPFCDKVRRILHVKHKRYEVREVPPHETLVQLKRINPAGKVPVIEHQGRVVWDSTEIARYLEEQFPEPSIYPSDARERALCDLIEDWADESLYFYEMWLRFGPGGNASDWSHRASHSEPPLLQRAVNIALPTLMRNVLKSQGLGRKPPERVLAELRQHLKTIAAWLGDREWLVGDRLSVADVSVYAQLACVGETGNGAALLGEQPGLLLWMERVDAATSAPV